MFPGRWRPGGERLREQVPGDTRGTWTAAVERGSIGSLADHRRSFGALKVALSDQRFTPFSGVVFRMAQGHAGDTTHAPKGVGL